MAEFWQPNSDLKSHAGLKIDDECVFPVAPPEELGDLISAFSDVSPNKDVSWQKRIWSGVGACCFTTILFGSVYYFSFEGAEKDFVSSFGVGAIFGLIFGVAIVFLIKPKFWVGYLGKNGLATYELPGTTGKPSKSELFLFKDACSLSTELTEKYRKHMYSGTDYEHRYRGSRGNTVFTLKGMFHKGKDGTPKKPDERYSLTVGAEDVFNELQMQPMLAEFEKHGACTFDVSQKGEIQVGDGYLVIDFREFGEPIRVEPGDIKSMRIAEGKFCIDTHDAKFFSRKGKFRFDYSQIANAKLFLHAMDQLSGFQLE